MTKTSLHENILSTEGVKPVSGYSFGTVFAVFVSIISLFPILNEYNRRVWSLIIAVIFFVKALIIPKAVAPLNWAWFQFNQLRDEVVTPIIMDLIFLEFLNRLGWSCGFLPKTLRLRL